MASCNEPQPLGRYTNFFHSPERRSCSTRSMHGYQRYSPYTSSTSTLGIKRFRAGESAETNSETGPGGERYRMKYYCGTYLMVTIVHVYLLTTAKFCCFAVGKNKTNGTKKKKKASAARATDGVEKGPR